MSCYFIVDVSLLDVIQLMGRILHGISPDRMKEHRVRKMRLIFKYRAYLFIIHLPFLS